VIMNCFYHPNTQAVTQCARPGCGKALCKKCLFVDRCYEHAKLSVGVDYKIANGRQIRLWLFTAVVSIGLWIALFATINEQLSYGGTFGPGVLGQVVLICVLAPIGAWLFYMGMSWIYEKLRGRGPAAVGVGYSPGHWMRTPTVTDTTGSLLGLVFVVGIILVLIAFLAWPVMIIGLFTGFQKYKIDRRVIRAYRDSSWLQMFPGQFNPETQQYIPKARVRTDQLTSPLRAPRGPQDGARG
jgi:hypothetical protein